MILKLIATLFYSIIILQEKLPKTIIYILMLFLCITIDACAYNLCIFIFSSISNIPFKFEEVERELGIMLKPRIDIASFSRILFTAQSIVLVFAYYIFFFIIVACVCIIRVSNDLYFNNQFIFFLSMYYSFDCHNSRCLMIYIVLRLKIHFMFFLFLPLKRYF